DPLVVHTGHPRTPGRHTIRRLRAAPSARGRGPAGGSVVPSRSSRPRPRGDPAYPGRTPGNAHAPDSERRGPSRSPRGRSSRPASRSRTERRSRPRPAPGRRPAPTTIRRPRPSTRLFADRTIGDSRRAIITGTPHARPAGGTRSVVGSQGVGFRLHLEHEPVDATDPHPRAGRDRLAEAPPPPERTLDEHRPVGSHLAPSFADQSDQPPLR